MSRKLGLWLLFTGGVAGIILLGYRHYSDLVADAQVLAAEKAQLELALAVEQEAVRTLRAQAGELEQRLREQSRVAARATAEVRRLNEIFAEHDLTRLALAKPGLVERRINDGTARVGRLLTCATTPDCDDGAAGRPEPAPTTPDPAATAPLDRPGN